MSTSTSPVDTRSATATRDSSERVVLLNGASSAGYSSPSTSAQILAPTCDSGCSKAFVNSETQS